MSQFQPTRILGIDPGSRMTGFGVIDVHGREHHYVASGCIKTPTGASLSERIAVIVRHIDEIIRHYQPHQAAIEQVFVNVNPAATLMLGQARGAAIAALVMHDLPVFEYTALQVRYTTSRCRRRTRRRPHPRPAQSRIGFATQPRRLAGQARPFSMVGRHSGRLKYVPARFQTAFRL